MYTEEDLEASLDVRDRSAEVAQLTVKAEQKTILISVPYWQASSVRMMSNHDYPLQLPEDLSDLERATLVASSSHNALQLTHLLDRFHQHL